MHDANDPAVRSDDGPADHVRRPRRTQAGAAAALWASRAWWWVRTAPGTYLYYLTLCVTTAVYASIPGEQQERFLALRSTNLQQLQHDPFHVLLTSAVYTEGPSLPSYFLLFTLVHAPVERWLGTRRWLAVVVVGHVGATYLSQGVLEVGIEAHFVPRHLRHIVDVGVSYGLAACAGVAVYAFVRPWRWLYLVGVVLWFLVPLVMQVTVTSIGHLSALTIGFACYGFAYGRPQFDPAAWVRRLVGWMRERRGRPLLN